MSSDSHIKFDGVDGESTHKDHKGEIAVCPGAGVSQQPSALSGGGSGKGKAIPSDFSFTHLLRQGLAGARQAVRLGQALQGHEAHRAQGRRGPEGLPGRDDEGSADHLGAAVRRSQAATSSSK